MLILLLILHSRPLSYQFISNELLITGYGNVTKNDLRIACDYSQVTTVDLAEGVSGIEDSAFDGCSKLKKITIPSTVTYISLSAFFRCAALASIIVSKNNTVYSSDSQNALYNHNQTILLRAPTIQNFNIPEGVEVISSESFRTGRGYRMSSITFPNSLRNIEGNAFSYSTIKHVIIPRQVTALLKIVQLKSQDYDRNH